MAGLIDSLIPILQQDALSLSELERSLHDERSALETRDSAGLQQALTAKAEHAQQLEQNARLKAELFARHNLKLSPEHAKQALTKIGRGDVVELWERVAAQLDHCKMQNEVNARILSRSQHSLHRVMNILRGQDSQQHLYGQNGQGAGLGGRHLLANA